MSDYIIKTKFLPPSASKKHWEKPGLWGKYRTVSNYPLTLVKAGPGYGKSTTIAGFFANQKDCYWYNVDEMDADPAVFFLNIFSAFHLRDEKMAAEAISSLTEQPEYPADFIQALNFFINDLAAGLIEDTYLIIDDLHLVANNAQIMELLAYFIKMMPPQLHLILSTREKLNFKEWASWRLKRTVLVIDESDLMLNEAEIVAFFAEQYGIVVSAQDAKKVAQESEGWIIALDLLGQGLSHGAELNEVLGAQTKSLDLLFEYLAFEVLENQSAEVREFLLKTAVLKNLKADICDELLKIKGSVEILEEMKEKGLFLYLLAPGLYRYHHLVREFLRKIGQEEYNYNQLHRRSAEICVNLGETGLAIYHSLMAEDYEQAAELIISSADEMLQLGRLDSLQTNLDGLPEEVFTRHPKLYLLQGEVLRLKSSFNAALEVFEQARKIFAEQEELLNLGKVSQKIALVYLDTVQPTKAHEYLQEALLYRNKENLWEEATILRLMAENKANKGDLDQALALQEQAQQLDQQDISHSNIRARLLLRTGKLEDVIRLLESRLDDEESRKLPPRSHRETMVVLSLAHSLKGNVDSAHNHASLGVELGKQLDSPFVIAVAYMRLGHSLQLQGRGKIEQARKAYHESLRLVDGLDIARGRAEPLLGLALLEAFHGDSHLGLKYGDEGLYISRQSGDKWLGGLLKLSIGINHYFLNEFKKAIKILSSAVDDFSESKDSFSRLTAESWLALLYFASKQKKKYEKTIEQVFTHAQEREYNCLFTKSTLLGFRNPELIAPLLLDAREKFPDNKLLQGLIAEQGWTELNYHPGYPLRITSFGNLRVWRGKEEIGGQEWQREKALELFLLLFINRGRYLPKETLHYSLWPNDDEETAARNFKVSLNALRKALEPDRKAQQQSFYIIRNRSNYGFNEEASYFFDTKDFEELLEKSSQATDKKTQLELAQAAMELYQGDFLADFLYVDWIADERERLRHLFLTTADKLARHYYQIEANEEALKTTDLLLEHDPCWEPAYLLKMKIYNRTGRPYIATKVYQQCKTTLDRELNVLPMPQIERYYQELIAKM